MYFELIILQNCLLMYFSTLTLMTLCAFCRWSAYFNHLYSKLLQGAYVLLSGARESSTLLQCCVWVSTWLEVSFNWFSNTCVFPAVYQVTQLHWPGSSANGCQLMAVVVRRRQSRGKKHKWTVRYLMSWKSPKRKHRDYKVHVHVYMFFQFENLCNLDIALRVLGIQR